MSTISTLDFRVQNVTNFINSLYGEDGVNSSYVFIGKPTPWADENRPPQPKNNLVDFFGAYQQMLSMRRILGNECYPMFRRITWRSGTTFDIYRHDYTSENPAFTGAFKLEDATYYCITSKNVVYVCLDNSNNRPSIVEPQNDNYEPFFTSDGYQWLKLFSIDSQVLNDFSTLRYLPLTSDGANLDVQPRVGGEITTVLIDNAGNDYTISPGGVSNEVPAYYCRIVGDGDGAVASVRILPPSTNDPELGTGIGAVRVVRGGSGYTYATLDFTPGRCYSSLSELDENINGLDPRGDGTFQTTVIINPPNGWGHDLGRQLSATTAGVFSSFNYSLSDFFTDTTFRQIGILQNPETNEGIPDSPNTLSGCFAYRIVEIEGQTDFIIGENIYQQRYNEELQRSQTARGRIVGWDQGERVLRYIQIPEEHVDSDGVLYQFDSSTFIHGETSKKVVEPTSYNGSLAGLVFVNGFADTEVKRYSGNMLYLSNISPVLRQPTQTERISLLIQF